MFGISVDHGAVPGVVGALAHGVHVARARRALQQRAGLRGGRAGRGPRGRGPRGRGPRGPGRRRAPAAPRAAHLPVPRRRRADPRGGA